MIGFVILHYMVEEETKKCVNSILELNGEKKIIIVDNCSPNNSYNLLKEYYEKKEEVIVIKNIANNGFAKGNNFGYKFAREKFDLDFIVFMNNDMEINQKDFISKIYDIYEKDNFYVLGPDIYSTSQKIHQNPEIRTIRTKEKVENELKYMQKVSKNIGMLKIKGIFKKIPYLESSIKFFKNIKRKKSENYLKKQYNTTLHGSCLIFSRLFMSERREAFFGNTLFYCEAQILDYECEKNEWMRLYSPELKVLHHEDVATNATYKSYVKKALFMNKCMCDSLMEFLKLIEEYEGKEV